MKKIMITIFIVLVVVISAIYLLLQQKTFGKNPEGECLSRIEKSTNYKNGSFQNLSPTEEVLKDASYPKMILEFLNKPENVAPPVELPSIETDLKALTNDKPTIVWFGHSSYLIKSKSANILVDPVLSGYASPFSFFGKSFKGTNVYTTADLPKVDVIIITHDHYDHLDYETITKLISPTAKFYTSLGVGAHLEYWGVDPTNIVEFDWYQEYKISTEILITALPARHFSGRLFTRGKTLWSSFALNIDGYKLYLGGDSGYDTHFSQIGKSYGPFDLAILECGQYGKDWPYIHMLPEQTALAAKDLNAKVLFPVHWAKFALSLHAWNEPINRLAESAKESDLPITTPMIGEPIVLDSIYPNKKWWLL